jgi:hypothetical protein
MADLARPRAAYADWKAEVPTELAELIYDNESGASPPYLNDQVYGRQSQSKDVFSETVRPRAMRAVLASDPESLVKDLNEPAYARHS